jgi:hypothetical protein
MVFMDMTDYNRNYDQSKVRNWMNEIINEN